jgi:5,10-methenyltetrahydrofolate synthetase
VTDEITRAKQELRRSFKAKAAEFFATTSGTELARLHEAVARNLTTYIEKLPDFDAHSRLSLYRPLPAELPMPEIVAQVPGCTAAELCYPEYDPRTMWFVSAATGERVQPDTVIVPGLYADINGNRLGRGKGYYDRFLAASAIGPSRRIFVCYDFQVARAIPVNKDDAPIGAIVTPSRIIKVHT